MLISVLLRLGSSVRGGWGELDRDGYNSIPITLVGTVLHCFYFLGKWVLLLCYRCDGGILGENTANFSGAEGAVGYASLSWTSAFRPTRFDCRLGGFGTTIHSRSFVYITNLACWVV